MSRRPTVTADLAEAIHRLDRLLLAEFGGNYQYQITALGRTVAAAHTERCAGRPDRHIHPKTRKNVPHGPKQQEEQPQGFPLRDDMDRGRGHPGG